MPDEARARLAVRARRFATRNFSLEQMGAATMKVYRELLDERGRDRAPIPRPSPDRRTHTAPAVAEVLSNRTTAVA